MINKVTLVGNLGRDPELRRFEGGGVVAKFPVATNENYKDRNGQWQTQTEWHDVVCWGPLAERSERDLKKGKLVYVEGKITHRKYTDQNNIERYITEILANTVRLLERRDGESQPPMGPPPPGGDPSSPHSNAAGPDQDFDLPF